jgi:NAD(P)-dependent dehydrogenase (short-subunit alcohol dehydrogenase family)
MDSANLRDVPPEVPTRSASVIIVARDNADGLAATVERLHRALVLTVDESEILIFDDGSGDNTSLIAKSLTLRFNNIREFRNATSKGAGYCFKRGISEARMNFVAYVPADNTWPYRSYVELFGNIGKADVITSYSRNLLGLMSPTRRFISRVYTVALNAVFRLGLNYYNGLTVYPAIFLRSANIASKGLSFQAEALITAIASGYSFIEVALPVDDSNVDKSRAATAKNILDAVGMLPRLYGRIYIRRELVKKPQMATNAVGAGQMIDELGMGGEMFASQPPARVDNTWRPLRVIITGASSGIGEALATALDEDGHQIFICARRTQQLLHITRLKPSVRALVCDVTDETDVIKFMAAVGSESNGIDVLINSVGSFGEIGPANLSNSSEWLNTLKVNVFGPYLTIKHALPLLEKGRMARIINVAGGGAFSAFPNYSAYACSKAALVRLTECLAAELRQHNIRVNAVSPGFIATDIHKSTIAAGEERAGRLQYRRTLALMQDDGPALEEFMNCIRAMLSPSFDHLTGKTISANFDPWQTDAFRDHIDDITSSDLYTMRRINLPNLTDGYLRKKLTEAWANFGGSN